MAMATGFYGSFLKGLFDRSGNLGIDFDADTIKVALVTNTYTPDFDAHDFWNDVTNEVSGTGYTAGGATLGSVTVSLNTTSNRMIFDAADTSWTSSTITARGAIVYKDSGTASTSPLICAIDFGSDKSSSAGTFQITWHADGIIYSVYVAP